MSRSNYLSPHQMQRLNLACLPVRDAFGRPPYLVGSVHQRADFRDVDVRTILADQEFDRWFTLGPNDKDGAAHADPRWVLICSALSEWLSSVSGLPIDYQIQRRTEANEAHPAWRSALAISMPWTGGAD